MFFLQLKLNFLLARRIASAFRLPAPRLPPALALKFPMCPDWHPSDRGRGECFQKAANSQQPLANSD
jgi:hypothetical protein